MTMPMNPMDVRNIVHMGSTAAAAAIFRPIPAKCPSHIVASSSVSNT